ncbi:PAS domain-containing sensor histidine kinase [Rhodococcus jostii]|uniref:Oxygen sensor histidine kinase NreB n=1 Tax=Rhodococcus jostii TaxID=132919 RepID=A0ABU4C7E3_RHOJO|nr:PAS domain-containing sensor histidine kinase [Rhodococcus jostii]MDV6279172.1 PAS domain-containing sensor histidine kinase [Rhodococcus jostii]
MNGFEDSDHANIAQLFHGIVEQSVAGIYLLQDGVMQYVNDKFADFFGTTPSRFMGRPLADIAPPEQRHSLVAQYERRVQGSDPESHFIIRANVRRRGPRLIEIHGRLVTYRSRPAVVGIGIDVTEREKALKDIEASRSQLRALMSAVETIQDTERTHIALELHDDIGGLLTALKFDVARLRRRLTDADAPNSGARSETADIAGLLQLTHEISGTAQEAIDAVRRISDELRPSLIDHLGMLDAIRDHAAKFQARYGIGCSVTVPQTESAADPASERDLFRIIQEALTNVARHASATKVTITLERDDDTLEATIEDDGVGLPTSIEESTDGLGLAGIRERARRIGGHTTIGNSTAGGARIEVRVPWAFAK